MSPPFDGWERCRENQRVAGKKARAVSKGRLEVFKIYHGRELLNIAPLMDAFAELTGEDYRAHLRAFAVIHHAFQAVVAPTPTLTKWVTEAALPWVPAGHDADLALTLSVLEQHQHQVEQQGKGEGGDDFGELRELLRLRHDVFSKLTDEQFGRAFGLMNPGKKTGATNHQIPSVAAELALAVHAFGYKRKTGEAHSVARSRVAKVFRSAWARHLKAIRHSV